MHVAGELEAAPFEVRQAVPIAFEIHPGRHLRRRETAVVGIGADIEDLLSGREDARAEKLQKHLSEPRPARPDLYVGIDARVDAGGDRPGVCARVRRAHRCARKVDAEAGARIGDHRLHGTPCEQSAAARLQDRPAVVRHDDLRIAPSQCIGIEHLVLDLRFGERVDRLFGRTISAPRHPQHAGALKQFRTADLGEHLVPPLQRALRHPRVDRVGPIGHADHARLAAGARPHIRRAILIQQDHAPPGASEMPRGPGPEHTGADHGNVVARMGAHLHPAGVRRTTGST